MAISENTNTRPGLKLIFSDPHQSGKIEAPGHENRMLADLIERHQNLRSEIQCTSIHVDPTSSEYDPALWPYFGEITYAEESARRAVIAHPVNTLTDFRVKARYLLDLLNSDSETGAWLDNVDTWKLLMSVVGPDYRPAKH